MIYSIPRGIREACSGIVEAVRTEPYLTYIKTAESVIGVCYSPETRSQEERSRLITAIKLNISNRKLYSYSLLARKYKLSISQATFKREKIKYLHKLAELCGFFNNIDEV